MHTVPSAGWLARTAVLATTLLSLVGCASTTWQTPVTAEMHQDVKNYVDFQIRSINELERRLERADTKDKYIATLDFTGSALASISARGKLLVARYPELNSRANAPSPIKEELERQRNFFREKAYVFQSLQAGAMRYGSHPSVMQALQKFAATTSRAD
jgi:hypothetical protein